MGIFQPAMLVYQAGYLMLRKLLGALVTPGASKPGFACHAGEPVPWDANEQKNNWEVFGGCFFFLNLSNTN